MNKKKILVVAMTLSMVAILALGATLAYFTDTDYDKNVMTLGGVEIEQIEQQRDENGELKPFEDNKPLMPAVYPDTITEDNIVGDDGFFHKDVQNDVDKLISVKNTADEKSLNKDAYVRTLIAFEGRSDVQGVYIGKLWNKGMWDRNWVAKKNVDGSDFNGDDGFQSTDANGLVNAREVVIDGVVHTVIECIYVGTEFSEEPGVLPAGKETPASLKQIFMAPTANNEISGWFGSDYTNYAISQAVQTEGFTDAETALDTVFGDPAEVSDEVIYGWFNPTNN